MNEEGNYAFNTVLDIPYEQALEKVKAGLKEEGFGVLTEVNVKKVMSEKLGVDFRAYTIIGACNPPLSHRSFTTNLEAGLVLPCNVIVYEEESGTAVTVANPVTMIATLGDPRLVDVAREAKDRLVRMVDNLTK
ncbi:MAG: DUF302 domain-containing protein [Nitrospiraceae bacterium]|nr:DUF302 domain-containing protein [Nitrospiraceae bacterium]